MAKKKKTKKERKKEKKRRYFIGTLEITRSSRSHVDKNFTHLPTLTRKEKIKSLFDYCIFHGHKNTYGTAEVTGARRTKLVKKHWAGFSSAKDRILSH